jgi:shikimate kinase
MIIFINGTIGVGKTTAARLLTEHLPGAVQIEGQKVGLTEGAEDSNQPSDEWIERALQLFANHRLRGETTFVIDAVMQNPDRLRAFTKSSDDFCLLIYLMADSRTLQSRIENNPTYSNSAEQLAQAVEIYQKQKPHLSSQRLGKLIDTSKKTPSTIVADILRELDEAMSC